MAEPEIAKRIAELPPEKQAALFERLRKQKGSSGEGKSAPAVIKHGRDDYSYLLSFAQQRLWFLTLYEPESPEYNIPQAFLIEGVLDPAVLEKAVNQVVARHETLRTFFVSHEGQPYQRIAAELEIEMPFTDLADLGEEGAWERAMEVAREDAKTPFDLATGPMIRVQLFRVGEEKWLLYTNIHHIANDQWSMGIFARELAAYYSALVEGGEADLPPMPIQYVDYGLWQRDWLSGEVLEKQIDFWRENLSGVPPIDLPLDRPRPPARTFNGDTAPFPLSREISDGVKKLASSESATTFMVLMAAFKTLLSHYTTQEDISVGTLIAGRRRAESEGIIGFFANTLVLRTDLSGDPTFKELVARERDVALDAFGHQDLPFEKLVDELNPPRDLARTPLCQSMLILLNAPGGALELPGAKLQSVAIDSRTSKMELTLYMTEGEDGLNGYLEYNSDLFDRETVDRMLGHFRTLLGAFAENPDLRLSEAPLLGVEERRRMIVELNDTAAETPAGTLPQWVSAKAAENPTAVAVEMGDQRLTYAEVEAESNRLARHLSTLGVGPEVLVGLCVDRSPRMVTALLGILKSGGAYVPLDPEYPAQRIEMMLTDSRAPVVVTEKDLLEKLPSSDATRVVLDRDAETIGGQSGEPFDGGAVATNLAYTIYTSGSTGRPKGVQISHAALVNFLASMQKKPGMGPEDTLLAVTTLSFDIAGLEMYLPLVSGGRLLVASKEDAQAGEVLVDKLANDGVTIMQATPASWRLLLGAEWEGSPNLKVLCGGEALPRDLADDLVGKTGELWNVYGPTESTIWSTLERMTADEGPVSIGLPLANTQAHLLSRYLAPVPMGVPGELLLGGDGLARGYRDQPAMTAERFIPDPVGDVPGARLYRTGDLARRLPDGRIDFLGRIDHQVKVRGFRIELGEIETQLGSHPAVAEVVVLAREDSPGVKRLVGYMVPAEGETIPEIPDLKDYLKDRLPDYMVPALFVTLDEFPLTPNGKVDRRSLPAPDASAAQAPYVAPRNAQEENMAEIWAELLKLDRVGVHDDFFDMGGDSLLVVRVVTKAAKAGIMITTKQAFQHKTIAELVDASGRTNIIAEQGPVTGVHPWTPAMRHFQDLDHPNEEFHSTAVLLEMREGALDVGAARKAIQALEGLHDTLRMRVVGDRYDEDRYLELEEPGRDPYLIHVDLSALEETDQTESLQQMGRTFVTNYKLQDEPLFKATVFELEAGKPELIFLTAHFYPVDLGSWGPLLDHFDTAYRQIVAGEELELQPKTTSAVDWAARLEDRVKPGGMEPEEIQYWLDQAPHQPATYEFDFEKGPNDWTAARVERMTLTAEDTEILLSHAPRAFGVQIDSILVTAILEAFKGWTGDRAWPIVLLGHGREPLYDDMDISRTVGWFNSMYPVNVDLGESDDLAEEALKVNEQLRAVPNGGMGYGLIKYKGGDQEHARLLREAPWPQIYFNYVGPDTARELVAFHKVEQFGGYFLDVYTKRLTPIVLTGMVVEDELLTKWEWSVNLFERETILELVKRYQEVVRWYLDEYKRRQKSAG